jgi:hypothetical protein
MAFFDECDTHLVRIQAYRPKGRRGADLVVLDRKATASIDIMHSRATRQGLQSLRRSLRALFVCDWLASFE